MACPPSFYGVDRIELLEAISGEMLVLAELALNASKVPNPSSKKFQVARVPCQLPSPNRSIMPNGRSSAGSGTCADLATPLMRDEGLAVRPGRVTFSSPFSLGWVLIANGSSLGVNMEG